jgi:hypothetical protein
VNWKLLLIYIFLLYCFLLTGAPLFLQLQLHIFINKINKIKTVPYIISLSNVDLFPHVPYSYCNKNLIKQVRLHLSADQPLRVGGFFDLKACRQ